MRKVIAIMLLAVAAMFGQLADLSQAVRSLDRPYGRFKVEYVYRTDVFTRPATYPAGQPHYPAYIAVYKYIKGPTFSEWRQIGQSFEGLYTPDGCFEDDPAALVAKALKQMEPVRL